MDDTILVTYASRTGATAGVAEAIGKTFAERGAQVEVKPMQEVMDLSAYRAVVAGSGIQNKQWLPEAMQFMRAYQAELSRMPTAIFLVCMTLAMNKGNTARRCQPGCSRFAPWSGR
jgi:menaquinone-dependent protoporphyrinogen oxidase